eukprot:13181717-Alexandrium_andersonii.AAC.1
MYSKGFEHQQLAAAARHLLLLGSHGSVVLEVALDLAQGGGPAGDHQSPTTSSRDSCCSAVLQLLLCAAP